MGNKTVRTTPGSDAKVIFQSMLMSDLHLESDNVILPEFPIVAPILMLAGDIGRPDITIFTKILICSMSKIRTYLLCSRKSLFL